MKEERVKELIGDLEELERESEVEKYIENEGEREEGKRERRLEKVERKKVR